MTDNHQLVPIQPELANLALPEEVTQRCLALGMPTQHIQALAQLPAMYGVETTQVMGYVEKGMTVPQVAECLRLQHEAEDLEDIPVEVLHEAVQRIGFHATNPV